MMALFPFNDKSSGRNEMISRDTRTASLPVHSNSTGFIAGFARLIRDGARSLPKNTCHTYPISVPRCTADECIIVCSDFSNAATFCKDDHTCVCMFCNINE